MNKNAEYQSIAILATGDEIVNGDILNLNAQFIAKALLSVGLTPGIHTICPDDQSAIEASIAFLLAEHEALIITGGLGPTSDDRTRFALSAFTKVPLVFDNNSWQHIQSRLQKFGLTVTENNRQQAEFPKGGTILPNPEGTACGCYLKWEGKFIFILPGPPSECKPMFYHDVLPELQKHFPENKNKIYKWRLFGVSEGEMATRLDELVAPYHCKTGYRIDHPYLEFKLQPHHDTTPLQKILAMVEKEIAPYQISSAEETASELLLKTLETYPGKISINDQATQGRLQSLLLNPATVSFIEFTNKYVNFNSDKDVHIKINGLTEYWENCEEEKFSALHLHLISKDQTQESSMKVPIRGKRTLLYSVEILSFHMNQFLKYVLEGI